MMDPVGSVIEANKAQWSKIGDCGPAADTASGRAGLHLQPAREEIARKLIGNHVKVLKDCTNSAPLTQLELKRAPWRGARVPPASATYLANRERAPAARRVRDTS